MTGAVAEGTGARLRLLGTDLVAGGFLAMEGLAFAAAMAALVFAGPLSDGAALGFAVMILATALASGILALTSRARPCIPSVQDVNIAVFLSALPQVAIAGTALDKAMTVITALALGALLFGLATYAIGRIGLARLLRVLPYPVLAGFLAAAGYLLLQGVVVAQLGIRSAGDDAAPFSAPAALLPVALSLGFGAAMFVAMAARSILAAPMVLVGAVAAFVAVCGALDLDRAMLRDLGLLPVALSGGAADPFALLASQAWRIDTAALVALLPVILLAGAMSVVDLSLTLAAIETAGRHDLDMNRELRVAGLSNVAVAALGGPTTFASSVSTGIARGLGARSGRAGLVLCAAMLACLPFASTLAGLIPTFVTTGMVLAIAASLLGSWLLRPLRALPRLDGFTVVAIVGTTAVAGLLWAIVAGVALSALIFAYRYGRLSVFRRVSSSAVRRSKVDRAPAEARILDRFGSDSLLLELQGYLFFGSIEQVLAVVRQRLSGQPPLKSLVISLRHVTGLDPSAAAGLDKIVHLCGTSGVDVFLTDVSPSAAAILSATTAELRDRLSATEAADLDSVLQSIEDVLIRTHAPVRTEHGLQDLLGQLGGDPSRVAALIGLMVRRHLVAGEALIRAGDRDNDIFFIESGRVTVRNDVPGRPPLRIRTMGPGAVVGEMTFYTGAPRTADIVADEPTVAYVLSGAQLPVMEATDAAMAALVHRLAATVLADKLRRTTAMLEDATA